MKEGGKRKQEGGRTLSETTNYKTKNAERNVHSPPARTLDSLQSTGVATRYTQGLRSVGKHFPDTSS